MKRSLFPFAILFTNFSCLMAGNFSSWSDSNMVEPKVFIENNGQFNEKLNDRRKILFGSSQQGLKMYWTDKGLTYQITEYYLSEEAEREIEEEGHAEEAFEKMQKRSHYLQMEWMDCNMNAEIVTEEKVQHYYTYKNPADKSGRSGIKAAAYKKIIYRNIYPFIDVEYILPDKGGVKYSFRIHPGADISNIKIKYSGADKISLNAKGEVEINSTQCGDFLEHRPETFYEDGNLVHSTFTLKNNIIGFDIPGYNKSKVLVIDPFVGVVNFPNTTWPSALYAPWKTHGYTVAYDNSGNAWVYGGGEPLHLAKYNSGGTLLWIFPVPMEVWNVGDFDVNKITGTAYVSEGFNHLGAEMVKVDADGMLKATLPRTKYAYEISHVRFNCESDKLYAAGGGVPKDSWQVFSIDTNLTSITGALITASPNGDHDVNLMTLDPVGGFMYLNFNYPAPLSVDYLHDNEMYKVPIPGFTPSSWIQPGPIYSFVELGSVKYTGPVAGSTTQYRCNRFNGMACSPCFLYTYDGETIKKWDKNTGTMITSVTTGGSKYTSGGLDVDNCEKIFAGVGNVVKVYDANLTFVTSYAVPNTVFDLKIDNSKNEMYATGIGFVCAVKLNPSSCPLAPTHTVNTSCDASGADATVTVTAGCITGYSYLWSPGGQTGATVTNLSAGIYTVTISENSCAGNKTVTDIITIPSFPTPSVTPTVQNTNCGSTDGSITLAISGLTNPTYVWNNSQTTQNISNLSAGTYSVTITDASGCTITTLANVTAANAPVPITAPTSISCFGGNNGSAEVTVSGGTVPYTYSWSNSQTTSAVTGLIAGNYTIIVTDDLGCSSTQTVAITEPSVLTATITSSSASCGSGTGSAVINGSGGTGQFTYLWDPTSQTTATATGLVSGSYTSTITDANGCSVQDTITVNSFPGVSVSVNSPPAVCAGDPSTLSATASSGTSAYTYLWSPTGQTGSSLIVSPGITTTYTIEVTDANGCSDTATTELIPLSGPSVTINGTTVICFGDVATLTASGGTGYSWNTGATIASITVNPSATITYTVIATNTNGCTAPAAITLTVSPPPVANATPAIICEGQNATLTATGGGTYVWNTAETTNTIIVSPTINTTYSVVVSIGSCTDTANTSVAVNPVPTAVAWSDIVITTGTSTTLAASGGSSYLWNIGQTDSIITVSPPTSTIYCVTVYKGSCIDSACVKVTVEPINCTPASNAESFVLPSAFSPNGDGQNDVWRLLYVPLFEECIAEFQVLIYNRWGEQIFEGTDINFIWDGTYKDKIEETAVFGYYLTGTFKDGTEVKKKGNISLMR